MKAYREMDDAELLGEQWVEVELGPKEMPGYKGERIACDGCGEGINYDRFLERDGEILCLACAHPEQRYYRPASGDKGRDQRGAESRCECA
jgi:formylmethanofuran dehydrogenase subunit E